MYDPLIFGILMAETIEYTTAPQLSSKPPMRLRVGHMWSPVMSENGISMAEWFMIRVPRGHVTCNALFQPLPRLDG